MKLLTVVLLFHISTTSCFSQNEFKAIVRDAESREHLPGASAIMEGTSYGARADSMGMVSIQGVPDGIHKIEFSFLGYETHVISVTFPVASHLPFEIMLQHEHEALEEIVISSTRSSRTFEDIPTRVEFIAGEELDEKANMKPGDIRMLLSESTGIQTQQTSATSANSSIRIQGLDGRYTQILKDGFPLYAGFSGGLGLLQIPPLDLKQVEVIKGSSSTLYGGGAIAGLVNLISREPSDERDLRLLVNGTSAGGLDLSGFYSETFGEVGLTFFGSRNSNAAYDPADIGLTAIPEFRRYTANPRVFFHFDDKTSLIAGVNYTQEERTGGDIKLIEGNAGPAHTYFEDNDSKRLSTQLSFKREFNETVSINIRNSVNRFARTLTIPGYSFDGVQNSTFTEVNISRNGERSEWIGGVNIWSDSFTENVSAAALDRTYAQNVIGFFIQNTSSLSQKIHMETGIRGDYVNDYGYVLLPRFSLLFKASEVFSSRIGGGFGYKSPTIFTEESERLQFRNVLPVSPERNTLEKSYGANWDFNYRTELGDVGFNINHLFFYTYLNNPLHLERQETGEYRLINLAGFTDSKGTETNIRFEYGDLKLFLGYTFTDTRVHDKGRRVQNPLTPRHRLNNVLMYEVEEKWKIGLEAYYFGEQRLTDDTFGKEYWICGFMVERIWKRFSLFLNFENFLDARQTRFDTIYTGSLTDPAFRDIYAPVDGFVVNGGLKLDL